MALITDAQLHAATEVLFNDEWADHTPVKFDNVRFVTPSDAEWVHCSSRPVEAEFLGCGPSSLDKHFTEDSVLAVGVYCPIETGDGTFWALVDRFSEAFRWQEFTRDGNVYLFQEPSIIRNPMKIEEGW